MSNAPRLSIIRSKTLSRYPELVHGVLVGPRSYLEVGSSADQPAVQFMRQIALHVGMQRPLIAMNVLSHGRRVYHVPTQPTTVHSGDGLVTRIPGIVLSITTADCVPIIAYDPINNVIGLAHAGRRGIIRGIVPSLVSNMKADGAQTKHIRVWLGPSAQPCCYVFDRNFNQRIYREITEQFDTTDFNKKASAIFLDMQHAIVRKFHMLGIPSSSIERDTTCTIHSKRLPSHRREKDLRSQSLWAYVGMKDPLDSFRGKRVLVIGLGLHGGGVDTVKWLVNQGAKVTVTDLKDRNELRPSLAALRGMPIDYVLGKHRKKDIAASDLVVVNPGVPRTSPYLTYAETRRIPIETDSSIFMHYCTSPVVGITGTKGKTSTSVLIASMLRASNKHVVAVGHFQVPMLSFLNTVGPHSTVVAELSSWRLERLAQRRQSPHIAVITNITPDHLNRYNGFSDYVRAKKIIATFQSSNDHVVLNRDDTILKKFGNKVIGHCWWFSLHRFKRGDGAFIEHGTIITREHGDERRIAKLPLCHAYGDHQVKNILAAVLAAKCAGSTNSGIRKALRSMKPIPHRFERIRKVRGVDFINDSAATTPEAAVASIAMVQGPLVLLAGGSDKKLPYRMFSKRIGWRVKYLILFAGEATEKIIRFLPPHTQYAVVHSMKDALTRAWAVAVPGDTVLLSPGAASFGIFLHEFDRGDQFRSLIVSLQ